MFTRLYRLIHHRADELLVTAVVLIGASLYYVPGLMPLLSTQGFQTKDAESTQVRDIIKNDFTKDEPVLFVLLKHKQALSANDPKFKAAAQDVVDQLKHQEGVETVHSYYDTGDTQFVSKDGRSTFLAASMTGDVPTQQKNAGNVEKALKQADLDMAFAGPAVVGDAITEQIGKDLSQSETISFGLLAILLIIVFRGFVAALLPLLLGAFTVIVAMMVLRIMVEVTTVVQYALNVIVLIGLGLAVDYSLLMVSRFREELVSQKGDTSEALRVTMHTAGRTIFFSGLTVIISLLSLLVFPIEFLRSMGLGGASAVFVAMGGALIVLPAILQLLGRRVNWLSFGSARRMDRSVTDGAAYEQKQTIWQRTGRFFMKYPLATLAVTLTLFAFSLSPFLQAKFATPDVTVLPADNSVRQATDRLKNDFPFSDNPIRIIYTTNYDNIAYPEAIGKLYDMTTQIAKLPNVRSVESIVNLPGQHLSREQYQQFYQHLDKQPSAVRDAVDRLMTTKDTLVNVTYTSGTMDSQTQLLVRDIRGTNHPDAAIKVGGFTAELVDLLDTLTKYIPTALALIGVTLFILLFLMLGSVVIPIKAMIQNVLSLGASFGALVWIFQDGNLADILHMNVTGSVDATQPVLIFAVAFGLSMDYSVFLYSRIKEEYDRSGDTNTALLAGLQKTGGIITSAAVLLFVVVAAFATSRISVMQQIGVGLAIAILVDAFIVRMVLVPAIMRLLGRVNWWAPRWMKWIHRQFGISE